MARFLLVTAAAAALFSTISVTGAARADGASPGCEVVQPAAERPLEKREWYGYQTLIADTAALGLALAGVAAAESGSQLALAGTGLGVYALGAPLVHAAHGRIGMAFGDLGLRVVVPLVLGVGGGLIGHDSVQPLRANDGSLVDRRDAARDNAATVGIAVGSIAGLLATIAVDAIVFAREPARERPGATSPMKTASVTPTVAAASSGASVGLAGTF